MASLKEKIFNRLYNMPFLHGADNVYRTPEYIVSQLFRVVCTKQLETFTISVDHYYLRTPERDADYEYAFKFRRDLNGRRIPTTTYERHYHN